MGNWQEHWLDYYQILGVEFGADTELIKKRYRELARMYHPDTYQGIDGDQKIKEINEAYEVLSSNEREKYDQVYIEKTKETYQEPPKYTEEEMRRTFSEEEIRYANKIALKQVIQEELEKAKIIIDAKNELLYQAYQEKLDTIGYFETLKEFIKSSNEYLVSLNELQKQAYEDDLLEEQESILEIINYLGEIINEMPTNLKDAKIFIKKEFIKEQLEEKKNSEISKANKVINDLMNFYKSIEKGQISKLEYTKYREIMILKLENAVSSLEKLLILLEEQEKEDILKIIGTCKGYIKSCPEKYKDAAAVGKKLVEQEEIQEALYVDKQVEERLDRIMNIIKKYPTNKKVNYLYQYAKSIMRKNRKNLDRYVDVCKKKGKIKTAYKDDLVKEALKLSYEAIELFNKTIKVSKKHQDIYHQRKEGYDGKIIDYLEDAVFNNIDEKEALKLLNEVNSLLAENDILKENINQKEQKRLAKLVGKSIQNLDNKEKELDSLYNQISNIIEKFNQYNQNNPQGKEYLEKLSKEIEKLQDCGINPFQALVLLAADPIIFIPSFWASVILHIYENNWYEVSDKVFIVSLIALGIKTLLDYPKGKNDKKIKEIAKEYEARRDYYDLKDRQYVFKK